MAFSVRIVKSAECSKCANFLATLDKAKFQYKIFDADNPDNIPQLDEWHIVEYPVVQIIDQHDKVSFQFQSGSWSIRSIMWKIADLTKNETK